MQEPENIPYTDSRESRIAPRRLTDIYFEVGGKERGRIAAINASISAITTNNTPLPHKRGKGVLLLQKSNRQELVTGRRTP